MLPIINNNVDEFSKKGRKGNGEDLIITGKNGGDLSYRSSHALKTTYTYCSGLFLLFIKPLQSIFIIVNRVVIIESSLEKKTSSPQCFKSQQNYFFF